MSDHTINVVPIGNAVQAEPNPFPGKGEAGITLKPGDTVTWIFPGDRKVEVVFEKSRDLPVNGNSFQASDPKGPFEELHVEKGRTVGRVSADLPTSPAAGMQRFFYRLLEDGNDVLWHKLPEGAGAEDTRLGGGVDVPKKPPVSGGGG
jgi:hypothetical protein